MGDLRRAVDGPTAGLHLKSVVVRLGGRDVLRGVDLQVGEGVTALVGRNGAGKTTLIRTITGVLTPRSGVVLRDGQDILAEAGLQSRHRRDLGWLPQEPGMPERMTVDDLLGYAAWLKLIPGPEQEAAVEAALAHADLFELRTKRLGRLSGGQRRRAALAAALVGAPQLALLDEPTNGLDPVQRERFLARIRAFAQGRIVILATHLLEDVALVADRWFALEAGRIVGSGAIERGSAGPAAASVDSIRAVLSLGSSPE